MSTPIKPAPGTGPLPPSRRVQAKIADHLAARAQAWAESRFGSMSMSAAVNVALAEAMPFLERQARLGRSLDSLPDFDMDARHPLPIPPAPETENDS